MLPRKFKGTVLKISIFFLVTYYWVYFILAWTSHILLLLNLLESASQNPFSLVWHTMTSSLRIIHRCCHVTDFSPRAHEQKWRMPFPLLAYENCLSTVFIVLSPFGRYIQKTRKKTHALVWAQETRTWDTKSTYRAEIICQADICHYCLVLFL